MLSEAEAVFPLLDLLQKELSGPSSTTPPPPPPCPPPQRQVNQLADRAPDGRSSLLLSFSCLPRVEQLITLLRLLCWYNTANTQRIVEQEGLELLAQSLRPGDGLILGEARRADVLWIMHDVVPFGASVLLAVGAVEEVLLVVVGDPEERSALVLEAALSTLQEMLRFDGHKYLLRVVALADRLLMSSTDAPAAAAAAVAGVSSVLCSVLAAAATPAGAGGAAGGGSGSGALSAGRLTTRLRHLAGEEAFRGQCRTVALNILSTLELNNVS